MTPAPSRLRLPQGPARAAERRQASRDLQIAAALSIPDVLREAGIDPVPVLARVGLALDLFDSPGNWIAFDALGHLTNERARHRLRALRPARR